MSNVGHNGIAADQLRSIIERVEKLEGEKRAIADDIKDIYSEAKSNGLDPKVIKKIVSLRRMDAQKRREEQEIFDIYAAALGDFLDLPLGRAAVERARGR